METNRWTKCLEEGNLVTLLCRTLDTVALDLLGRMVVRD